MSSLPPSFYRREANTLREWACHKYAGSKGSTRKYEATSEKSREQGIIRQGSRRWVTKTEDKGCADWMSGRRRDSERSVGVEGKRKSRSRRRSRSRSRSRGADEQLSSLREHHGHIHPTRYFPTRRKKAVRQLHLVSFSVVQEKLISFLSKSSTQLLPSTGLKYRTYASASLSVDPTEIVSCFLSFVSKDQKKYARFAKFAWALSPTQRPWNV